MPAKKGPQPQVVVKFGVMNTYYRKKGVAAKKSEPQFIEMRKSTYDALKITAKIATNDDLAINKSDGGEDLFPIHRGSRFLTVFFDKGPNKTKQYQFPIPPQCNRRHIREFLKGSKAQFYKLEGRRYPISNAT
jgi:hypothetical protein